MQSEIAAEKCHPTLSLTEWCGQEKHGSLPPNTHKRFVAIHIPPPPGWPKAQAFTYQADQGVAVICNVPIGKAAEEADQRQLPQLLKFLCSNSSLLDSALSPGPTQPISAEVDPPATVPLRSCSPSCLLLRCPGHFAF